jgi:hypothetical protein
MRHVTWVLLMIMSVAVLAEDAPVWDHYNEKIVRPDGTVTNVVFTLFEFETKQDLEEFTMMYYPEVFENEPDGIEGFSVCDRNREQNIAMCYIYIVKMDIVDGINMWTLGHEVAHGILGHRYHK